MKTQTFKNSKSSMNWKICIFFYEKHLWSSNNLSN